MKRGTAVILTLLSCFFFPWPVPAALALFSALWVPLLPLATGILLDALSYEPHASAFPMLTLAGLIISAAAFFVRGRLSASIIRE